MTNIADTITSLEKLLTTLPAQIEAAAATDKDDILGSLLADQLRAQTRLPVLRRQLAEQARDARRTAAIDARAARVASHDADAKAALARAKAAEKTLSAALDAVEVLTTALGSAPVSAGYVEQQLAAKTASDRQRASLSGEAVEAGAEAEALSEAAQMARWAIGADQPSDARLRAQVRHVRIDADADDLAILDALKLDPITKARAEYLLLVENWVLIERADDVEAA